MKMPIVSLNNMAMNESVAATCCYSHNHINGHYFDSVLNGGALETRIIETPVYVNSAVQSWLNVTEGDFKWAVEGFVLEQKFNNVTNSWETGLVDSEGKWIVFNAATWPRVGTNGLAHCDHKGEYCSYISDYIHTPYTAHVGATVAHSASKNWADDHAAIRFNS